MRETRQSHRSTVAQQDLADLYLRPGFLLRRAHQISSAIFMNAPANPGVTATQFGVLTVLAAREPIDQISIAKHLKLDRSTTGLVVRNLEDRAMIERVIDPEDRRRRVLRLTAEGRRTLELLRPLGKASHDKALSVFCAEDARDFVALLARFIEGHDHTD